VENGKNGLQVEPRNPDALASSIRSLLQDKALASQLGAAGREKVARVFSSERMVDETIRLYREVSA